MSCTPCWGALTSTYNLQLDSIPVSSAASLACQIHNTTTGAAAAAACSFTVTDNTSDSPQPEPEEDCNSPGIDSCHHMVGGQQRIHIQGRVIAMHQWLLQQAS
jgi:hypothetical protein